MLIPCIVVKIPNFPNQFYPVKITNADDEGVVTIQPLVRVMVDVDVHPDEYLYTDERYNIERSNIVTVPISEIETRPNF